MKLNVREYVEKEKEILKENFKKIEKQNPTLTIYSNDKNGATKSYLKNKIKVGQELGVNVEVVDGLFPPRFHMYNPCILQLPVDNTELLIEYENQELDYGFDVDGFFQYGDIYNGNINGVVPSTPKGIIDYLYYLHRDNLCNLNVAIIGRGKLVGKPLASLLIDKVASLKILTSKSTPLDIQKSFFDNDIIILATGKDNYLTSNVLDGLRCFKNKTIIDTGIFVGENGKLHGELYPILDIIEKDYPNINYTPVPGGVGILTTLSLFKNVYKFYKED